MLETLAAIATILSLAIVIYLYREDLIKWKENKIGPLYDGFRVIKLFNKLEIADCQGKNSVNTYEYTLECEKNGSDTFRMYFYCFGKIRRIESSIGNIRSVDIAVDKRVITIDLCRLYKKGDLVKLIISVFMEDALARNGDSLSAENLGRPHSAVFLLSFPSDRPYKDYKCVLVEQFNREIILDPKVTTRVDEAGKTQLEWRIDRVETGKSPVLEWTW